MDRQMMEMEFMYTVTRITNVVVWGNTTSLVIQLVALCTDFDYVADDMMLIGLYSVGIAILCVSIYFMYDFSKTQHNCCCLPCNHLWSRCCAVASKQAIDDKQSMVRELCWILHGETCAELVDISEKKDTEMKRRRSSKLMPIDLGQPTANTTAGNTFNNGSTDHGIHGFGINIGYNGSNVSNSVRNSRKISNFNQFNQFNPYNCQPVGVTPPP